MTATAPELVEGKCEHAPDMEETVRILATIDGRTKDAEFLCPECSRWWKAKIEPKKKEER